MKKDKIIIRLILFDIAVTIMLFAMLFWLILDLDLQREDEYVKIKSAITSNTGVIDYTNELIRDLFSSTNEDK